jgi:hypothetical protein
MSALAADGDEAIGNIRSVGVIDRPSEYHGLDITLWDDDKDSKNALKNKMIPMQTFFQRLLYLNDSFISRLRGQITMLFIFGLAMNFLMAPNNMYTNSSSDGTFAMNVSEALWESLMCIMDPKFSEDAWLKQEAQTRIWVRACVCVCVSKTLSI